jgi:ribonuclease HI
MATNESPETLGELLQALERSDNLRSLARECGLTPGDLKRRLRDWRKQLGDEEGCAKPSEPKKAKTSAAPSDAAVSMLEADVLTTLPGAGVLQIWTDGASRGNPGPASIGVVFALGDGEPFAAHGEAIGVATNNAAEYQAVLAGLRHATRWKAEHVRLFLDSELVARQLTGQYRVKSQDLIPFFRQVTDLIKDFGSFQVRHVRREKNTLADQFANLALDGKLPW